MNLHAPSTRAFQSLARISRSSIANPPSFAVPVDADEDETSITVVFHVPTESHEHVRVQISDQNITLWGRSPAMRLCALPCSVVTQGIETSRSGELLRVRIPKKRPANLTNQGTSESDERDEEKGKEKEEADE
jgi:HSP20 family molecular chaperone IbpA